METIGVRELKSHLSAYLRRVAAGEVILVSDHGRVVAELRQPAGAPAGCEDLPPLFWSKVARGEVKLASVPHTPDFYDNLPMSGGYPKGTAQRLIDEDRAER